MGWTQRIAEVRGEGRGSIRLELCGGDDTRCVQLVLDEGDRRRTPETIALDVVEFPRFASMVERSLLSAQELGIPDGVAGMRDVEWKQSLGEIKDGSSILVVSTTEVDGVRRLVLVGADVSTRRRSTAVLLAGDQIRSLRTALLSVTNSMVAAGGITKSVRRRAEEDTRTRIDSMNRDIRARRTFGWIVISAPLVIVAILLVTVLSYCLCR